MRIRIVDASDMQEYTRNNEREITCAHAYEPAQSGENLSFVQLAGSRDNEAQNGSSAGIPCPLLGDWSRHPLLPQSLVKKLSTVFAFLGCGSDHFCTVRTFDVGFRCCRRIDLGCHFASS